MRFWRKRVSEEEADKFLHVSVEFSHKLPEFFANQPEGFSYPCPKGYGTHLVTWQPRLECKEEA